MGQLRSLFRWITTCTTTRNVYRDRHLDLQPLPFRIGVLCRRARRRSCAYCGEIPDNPTRVLNAKTQLALQATNRFQVRCTARPCCSSSRRCLVAVEIAALRPAGNSETSTTLDLGPYPANAKLQESLSSNRIPLSLFKGPFTGTEVQHPDQGIRPGVIFKYRHNCKVDRQLISPGKRHFCEASDGDAVDQAGATEATPWVRLVAKPLTFGEPVCSRCAQAQMAARALAQSKFCSDASVSEFKVDEAFRV